MSNSNMLSMMKQIVLSVVLGLSLVSCGDFLNLSPLNKITENDIYTSESGVQAYFATLYNRLPIEDFNYTGGSGFNNWPDGSFHTAISCDEAIHCEWPHEIFGNTTSNGCWHQWWAYDNVRNVNTLMEKIEQSADFDEARKKILLAECRGIRAWYYFGLAKRYGGVPLIDHAQQYDENNVDELKVPRSTEEDTYNFILADLDAAIDGLPAERPSEESNRLNRYSVQALKSRVMLYAASIARYGSYQLEGLTGFSSKDKAVAYYEEAIAAASDVIAGGRYKLYEGNADKAKNFQELFWQKSGCPEVIFAKRFEYPSKTHNWDLWQAPFGYRFPEGYGSRLSPTLNLVEAFKKTDGTSGTLKTNSAGWVVGDDGNIAMFDDRTDLFANRDNRLYASILIPGASWTNAKGDVSGVIDVKRGVVELNGNNVAILKEGGSFTDVYQYGDTAFTVIGAQGVGGSNEVSITGLYNKKFLYEGNCPNDPKQNACSQDWFELRYAEVLLNYAEAAAELAATGNTQYAATGLDCLNEVRRRAGVKEATALTVEAVRNEMQVEFMFENHRFWDIKRWRIADQLMDNTTFNGLYPYYAANIKKWIFRKVKVGNPHAFKPYMYYIRINDNEISNNPKIKQNPGY